MDSLLEISGRAEVEVGLVLLAQEITPAYRHAHAVSNGSQLVQLSVVVQRWLSGCELLKKDGPDVVEEATVLKESADEQRWVAEMARAAKWVFCSGEKQSKRLYQFVEGYESIAVVIKERPAHTLGISSIDRFLHPGTISAHKIVRTSLIRHCLKMGDGVGKSVFSPSVHASLKVGYEPITPRKLYQQTAGIGIDKELVAQSSGEVDTDVVVVVLPGKKVFVLWG